MARYTLRGRDSGANPLVQYVTWGADAPDAVFPDPPPYGGPIVEVVVLSDKGLHGIAAPTEGDHVLKSTDGVIGWVPS